MYYFRGNIDLVLVLAISSLCHCSTQNFESVLDPDAKIESTGSDDSPETSSGPTSESEISISLEAASDQVSIEETKTEGNSKSADGAQSIDSAAHFHPSFSGPPSFSHKIKEIIDTIYTVSFGTQFYETVKVTAFDAPHISDITSHLDINLFESSSLQSFHDFSYQSSPDASAQSFPDVSIQLARDACPDASPSTKAFPPLSSDCSLQSTLTSSDIYPSFDPDRQSLLDSSLPSLEASSQLEIDISKSTSETIDYSTVISKATESADFSETNFHSRFLEIARSNGIANPAHALPVSDERSDDATSPAEDEHASSTNTLTSSNLPASTSENSAGIDETSTDSYERISTYSLKKLSPDTLETLSRDILKISDAFKPIFGENPSSHDALNTKKSSRKSHKGKVVNEVDEDLDFPKTFLHRSKCCGITVKEIVYEEDGHVIIPWTRKIIPDWMSTWLNQRKPQDYQPGDMLDYSVSTAIGFVREVRNLLVKTLSLAQNAKNGTTSNCTSAQWNQFFPVDFILFDNMDEPQKASLLSSEWGLEYPCFFRTTPNDTEPDKLQIQAVGNFLQRVTPIYEGFGFHHPVFNDAAGRMVADAFVRSSLESWDVDSIHDWVFRNIRQPKEPFDEMFITEIDEREFFGLMGKEDIFSIFLQRKGQKMEEFIKQIQVALLLNGNLIYHRQKTMWPPDYDHPNPFFGGVPFRLWSLIWKSDDLVRDHRIYSKHFPSTVFADWKVFKDSFLGDINAHLIYMNANTSRTRLLLTLPNLLSRPVGLSLEVTCLRSVHLRDGHYMAESAGVLPLKNVFLDLREVTDFDAQRLNNASYLGEMLRHKDARLQHSPRRFCRFRYLTKKSDRKLFCDLDLAERRFIEAGLIFDDAADDEVSVLKVPDDDPDADPENGDDGFANVKLSTKHKSEHKEQRETPLSEEEERNERRETLERKARIRVKIRCTNALLQTLDVEPSKEVDDRLSKACRMYSSYEVSLLYEAKRESTLTPTGLLAVTDQDFSATNYDKIESKLVNRTDPLTSHCVHVDKNEFYYVTFSDDEKVDPYVKTERIRSTITNKPIPKPKKKHRLVNEKSTRGRSKTRAQKLWVPSSMAKPKYNSEDYPWRIYYFTKYISQLEKETVVFLWILIFFGSLYCFFYIVVWGIDWMNLNINIIVHVLDMMERIFLVLFFAVTPRRD